MKSEKYSESIEWFFFHQYIFSELSDKQQLNANIRSKRTFVQSLCSNKLFLCAFLY